VFRRGGFHAWRQERYLWQQRQRLARLEALAEPGGIMVSSNVIDQVRDKLSFGFEKKEAWVGEL